VSIFGASCIASDAFIVMEWLGGGSWYEVLGDAPPPSFQRLKGAREVASALE